MARARRLCCWPLALHSTVFTCPLFTCPCTLSFYAVFFRKRKWNSLMVRALSILHNVCLDSHDEMSSKSINRAIDKHARLTLKEKAKYAALVRANKAAKVVHKDSLARGVARRQAVARHVGAKV